MYVFVVFEVPFSTPFLTFLFFFVTLFTFVSHLFGTSVILRFPNFFLPRRHLVLSAYIKKIHVWKRLGKVTPAGLGKVMVYWLCMFYLQFKVIKFKSDAITKKKIPRDRSSALVLLFLRRSYVCR